MRGMRTAIERLFRWSRFRVRPEMEFLRRSVSQVLARWITRRESSAEIAEAKARCS